ncbi:unnamed protein product [Ambrosiozyma monospora]|uniref:Unnamed protein product n=1 Tax=Ambrosiozyma monospora TaxID=43982 RepID=A0ACB5U5A7_AMBMO|nr:unnamed protein product [Ambrosiozyma monospora]
MIPSGPPPSGAHFGGPHPSGPPPSGDFSNFPHPSGPPPSGDFSDFPHPSGPAPSGPPPDFSGSFDGPAPSDTVLTSADDGSNTEVAKRQVSEGAGNTVQAVVGLAMAGWMLALL